MKILQFPIIKITVFFILGILFGFYIKLSSIFVFSGLFLSFVLLLLSFFKSNKINFKSSFFGLTVLFVSFFIGISTQFTHNDLQQKSHYFNQISDFDQHYLLEITLKEKLKLSALNYRFIAIVNKLENKESTGKIILNIRKDSLNNQQFEIGSVLKFSAKITKNKPIKNPNQFDYGKYLENKNIFAQVYTNVKEIKVASVLVKDIRYYTARFRNRIIENLEKNDFGKQELAVVVALILGQQQDISPEILNDYQFAGAVHVLSVSGLHVGFILLFLERILKPFPNTKKWKFNKLLIIILSLWAFGFIAGLAPSVLRSVVMFSFVAVGRHMGRGINIYNTLLVSAFVILLYEPSFLFDIGFQLSYVSLFFIVWLQPLFENIWQPKIKIIIFIWEIITVSFAAQIGAMGLSIYYFHQFPGLFFLTNLIILPAIGFVLGYGVFIMILAYFDFAPQSLTHLLEISISILNKVIAWIASFEQFVFQNIVMNKLMLLSFYLMVIMVVIYFKKPKFKNLTFALLTIILFQISIFSSKYYYQNQSELVVFNVKKHTIISERFGQQIRIYANDSILKNCNQNATIKQYLIGNFSKIADKNEIPNILFFKNQKILILNKIAIIPKNINPDILIITHSPKLNLERFLKSCQPKIIVADGSNFKTYVNAWRKTCEYSGIKFHSTAENGFYSLK